MKVAVCPETWLERFALWIGLVPVPLFETHINATLARAVMAGVELDMFECLGPAPLAIADIADRCNTNLGATASLLAALVGSGYLTLSKGRYALAYKSRKWLLRDSKHSVRDKILLQNTEWQWLAHLERFVRTGEPLDFHTAMTDTELDLYHRSMRAIARIAGREVAWRTPVPQNARHMLDLGGSHGHFAASICRQHRNLEARILDLPEAVARAAPMLASEGLGSRVAHVAGDVTQYDFGAKRYDLIFMSNLAHHLDDAQNLALAHKVARALRPGGIFVIQEPVKLLLPKKAGQIGTMLGLYFALQSRPGAESWTIPDIRGWQTAAGLTPFKPVRLLTAPGWVQQAASL